MNARGLTVDVVSEDANRAGKKISDSKEWAVADQNWLRQHNV